MDKGLFFWSWSLLQEGNLQFRLSGGSGRTSYSCLTEKMKAGGDAGMPEIEDNDPAKAEDTPTGERSTPLLPHLDSW